RVMYARIGRHMLAHEPASLANTRIDFAFVGRAAHAAAAPHLGRSALDAVELMNVGVLQRTRPLMLCAARKSFTAVAASSDADPGAGQRLRLSDAGFLRQARQRVVFAEDGDHWSPAPGLAHRRRRDPREVLCYAKSLPLKCCGMLRAGAELAVAQFRNNL